MHHGLVLAGEVAQARFVVRVGQHAHVEDVVRVHRDAALERERLEHQGQLPRQRGHEAFHVALQLRGADGAGVDDMRLFAQVREQFTLEFDGFQQRVRLAIPVVAGQRMAAAGFREAAHQRVRRGIQEQRMHGHAFRAQPAQLLRHQGQCRGAAHVHGNGHPVAVVLVLQRHEGREQLRGQIVHAVVARVFQRMQRHGLAGARHARDQHDLQRFSRHGRAPLAAARLLSSISRACARVAAEARSPPSMRAISWMRRSPSAAATVLTVPCWRERLDTTR